MPFRYAISTPPSRSGCRPSSPISRLLSERVLLLRGRLAEEAKDVEALESFSPARIWAVLRGSRTTDLDRERAEHEAARYAVAESEARTDLARRDAMSLQAQIDALGDVNEVHRRALDAKEKWALANDPTLSAALDDLARQHGEIIASQKETAEAYAAGEAALVLVDEALDLLGNAESWSTFDLLGGGALTDLMKYAKMDEAANVLRRADVALGRFSRELADVCIAAIGGVQIDSMTRAFDVFFDNIFSDLGVRSRIQDAGRRANAARRAVREALVCLEKTSQELAAQLVDIQSRRDQLLTG